MTKDSPDSKPESATDRARRLWHGAKPQTPTREPGNVTDAEAALARRAQAHGLTVSEIRNPSLLAFLGAVARAEAMAAGFDDVLVLDRADFAHRVAVARERGFIDESGRLTDAARDYAGDQLSPLLLLLLARPRHG